MCLAVLLVACGRDNDDTGSTEAVSQAGDPPTAPSDQTPAGQLPQGASVHMAPTQGNKVHGALVIAAADGGVRISGALQELTPNGEFGFHIHEKGDCSAPDASSAGEHFNPDAQPHGHPERDPHHKGDIVNLQANGNGVAQVDVTVRGVTLHDGRATDVLGRAVVVHAKPDDYKSQPSGDSGDRIACGVVAVGPA
jgi:Cu-Zn family superoxide dismutase